MTIYIDSDFKCHTTAAEGRTAIETETFDGKCKAFIEGYRFVPPGQTWTRADGTVFHGIIIAPWRDYRILAEIQAQHEADEAAHAVELGTLVDIIYQSDMEVIG